MYYEEKITALRNINRRTVKGGHKHGKHISIQRKSFPKIISFEHFQFTEFTDNARKIFGALGSARQHVQAGRVWVGAFGSFRLKCSRLDAL